MRSKWDLWHTKSVSHIDSRRSALQNTKCPHNGGWHSILRLVDPEVGERTLSLRSPVLVCRDLDLAKGIGLGSRVCCHSYGCRMEISLKS